MRWCYVKAVRSTGLAVALADAVDGCWLLMLLYRIISFNKMKWNQMLRELWFLLFCLFIFFIYVNIFILFFFLDLELNLVLFFLEMLVEVSMGIWESDRGFLLSTSNALLLYADTDLFLALNLQLLKLRLWKHFLV